MAASNHSPRYHLITPDDLEWRLSNLMKIPNADYLERTGTEVMGARLWRLPPGSANTLHRHNRQTEFFIVLEGTGRIRIDGDTLTVPRLGGVLAAPAALRQIFNDTAEDTLWLIVGAPEECELLPGADKSAVDMSLYYPEDPTSLPPELAGTPHPPAATAEPPHTEPAPVDFSAVARDWLAAWNAHDLERILAHYAENIVFTSPFVQRLTGRPDGVLHGRRALRDYFARGLQAYPDLCFELIHLLPGVRSMVLEYRSVNDLRAAEFMEFDHRGRIRRVCAHYTPMA